MRVLASKSQLTFGKKITTAAATTPTMTSATWRICVNWKTSGEEECWKMTSDYATL